MFVVAALHNALKSELWRPVDVAGSNRHRQNGHLLPSFIGNEQIGLPRSVADKRIGAISMTHFNPASVPGDLTPSHIMLTTREAADYLGLAPATLNKWRCLGVGPAFVRLGRAIRYRRDHLDAFLIAHTTVSC